MNKVFKIYITSKYESSDQELGPCFSTKINKIVHLTAFTPSTITNTS